MRWLTVVLVLVVAGCGGDRAAERDDPVAAPTATAVATSPAPQPAPPPTTTAPPATTEAPATPCVAGSVVKMGSERHAFAATVPRRATAHREPDGAQLASFERLNVNRYPTTFGVLAKRVDGDCRATWYRVQLPLRPNGVTGWVRATEVELRRVTTRILVELSARRVTLYEAGRQTFAARAAIGSSATPTPTGSYYVNQRLVPSDPSGPFGPGAIGISAFSPVLTGWAQGGPIAIHGTNRPDLIGQAVSNGCIRLRNEDLLRLFERSPAGTPVLVRA